MGIDQLLRKYFGHPEFRPGQRAVVEHVEAGGDGLVVMPTGHGKSLCYQLPAIAHDGLTLVISPLIALMKDQVDALQSRGIAATLINSSISTGERRERIEAMVRGEHRLVYVAPERFTVGFMSALKQTDVRLLAIDEAHCISQWGHDFRPDYLRLGAVREALGVPTIALTATATPAVQTDILAQLGLPDARRFITGFDRENLALDVIGVRSPTAKLTALPGLLREQPALVYCATRKHVQQTTDALVRQGFVAAAYHAGLSHEHRRRTQTDFLAGRIPIVVATNAFGMGIDKADIRTIIHTDLPGTIEAYYQEIGRAGRDGKPARAVLLYRPADRGLQEFFISGSHPPASAVHQVYSRLCKAGENPVWQSLAQLADGGSDEREVKSCLAVLRRKGLVRPVGRRDPVSGDNQNGIELTDPERSLELTEAEMKHKRDHAYAQLDRIVAYGDAPCQRKAILEHFGETPPWERCDRCTGCHTGRPMVAEPRRLGATELTRVRHVLACMDQMNRPMSASMVARVVTGSRDRTVRTFGFERLSTWGLLAGWSQAAVMTLLGAMEAAGLVRAERTTGAVQGQTRTWKNLLLTDEGRTVMHSESGDVALVMPEAAPVSRTRIDATQANDGPIDDDLLANLKTVRLGLARDEGVPAYVVASNRTLMALASMRPTTTADLDSIHGMGTKRIARYGDAFVNAVRGWTRC